MSGPRATVAQLAARFRVRARARRSAYLAGRSLADTGAVSLGRVEADLVVADVVDELPYTVEIRRVDDDLVIACSCGEPARHGVCRHAVAVEHAIWTQATGGAGQ